MQTFSDILSAVLDTLAAGSAWICVWGWIGRLVGDKRGRPVAGAWLGLLFGPFGVAAASRLEDPRARRTPCRKNSETLRRDINKARLKRLERAERQPKPETEMQAFERIFAEGQAAAAKRRQ